MSLVRPVCCIAVVVTIGLLANSSLAHKSMDPDMWMAPEKEAHLLNPVPADPDAVARGGRSFSRTALPVMVKMLKG